jgi:hypothetical protein
MRPITPARLILSIAEEYRADFGGALKPPPAVTAFRYKAAAAPTKNLEDKVYEIEDDLRLATGAE